MADGGRVLKPGETMALEPKDFIIVWGENPEFWRLPNEKDPTAELKRASWLDVTFKIKVPELRSKSYRFITVEFDLCKTADSSGWEDAKVHVVMRPEGQDSWDIWFCDVKDQIDAMKPNERTRVRGTFGGQYFENPDDYNFRLGLLDTESGSLKRGMIFYGATVRAHEKEEVTPE